MTQSKYTEFKYKKLTGAITGAAMNIYSELGNGFREVAYHRCMKHELAIQGLNF